MEALYAAALEAQREHEEALLRAKRELREARGEVGLADPIATGFKMAFGAWLFSLIVGAIAALLYFIVYKQAVGD